MRDRLIFQTTKLNNGITIYSYPMDVEFAVAQLVVPVGTANNTADVLPGSAHMLEHMLMNRSKLHPQPDQYKVELGLNGGYSNASTAQFTTSYDLDCPSVVFADMWPGFLARPLDPFLSAEDLENERSVISNERNLRRWYPGSSELSHYLHTEWKSYTYNNLNQIFGSDEDLGRMTVESLSALQKNYYDPRTFLIIGGKFDFELVKSSLEKIETKKHSLSEKNAEVQWKNKEYQEKTFRDINTYTYITSAIFPTTIDFDTVVAMNFMFRIATNSTHKNLYHWLREEKGWAYAISKAVYNTNKYWGWEIEIDLDKKEYVETVRKELHQRFIAIITNEEMVRTEVERLQKSTVFYYQTIHHILESAFDDLDDYGKIYTEAEHSEAIKRCLDVTYLKKLYDYYIAPPNAGEFLAMPERADS